VLSFADHIKPLVMEESFGTTIDNQLPTTRFGHQFLKSASFGKPMRRGQKNHIPHRDGAARFHKKKSGLAHLRNSLRSVSASCLLEFSQPFFLPALAGKS